MEPLDHLIAEIILVFVTVFLHGVVTRFALLFSITKLAQINENVFSISRSLFLSFVVVIIMSAHMLEIVTWACAVYILKIFDNFSTSYYFTMETYTTLGHGEAVLPQEWRSLAGWLATTGILMFGWSTAVFTNILNRLYAAARLLP